MIHDAATSQKLEYIPFEHTDFVFVVVPEKPLVIVLLIASAVSIGAILFLCYKRHRHRRVE